MTVVKQKSVVQVSCVFLKIMTLPGQQPNLALGALRKSAVPLVLSLESLQAVHIFCIQHN